jgi:hypothetical protein
MPGDRLPTVLERKERAVMSSTTLTRPAVEQLLRQSALPALRKLCVEETDEAVVLTGSVSSYYLKQLAQETVMPVLGERELFNRVKVVRPD